MAWAQDQKRDTKNHLPTYVRQLYDLATVPFEQKLPPLTSQTSFRPKAKELKG